MTSPVTFERRGAGREVAMLGAVEVGQVVEHSVSRRIGAYWRSTLPDHAARMVPARDFDEARQALGEHVWEWLARAGLSLNRSQDQAHSRGGRS